jgi:hypothetical protein
MGSTSGFTTAMLPEINKLALPLDIWHAGLFSRNGASFG